MREFGFELRLCVHLEAEGELLGRQLGAGVHRPGGRVVDVVCVEPGPEFDERTALTPETIPDIAIEADVGPGSSVYWKAAISDLDIHPTAAREAIERAIDIGFFERERRNGRTYVRQVGRYPDWFGRLRAIENKPDLDEPGNLTTQLRKDVTLGLADEIVLATESYVTRAHLNRIPAPVGVWRFHEGMIEVVREPTRLDVSGAGIELLAEQPARTDIKVATATEKDRARRRLAEYAYGKGWRTYELPGCANAEVAELAGVGGLPRCHYHGRLVDPSTECGRSCPGFDPGEAPNGQLRLARDRTSPWVADPTGRARQQSRLDRFAR